MWDKYKCEDYLHPASDLLLQVESTFAVAPGTMEAT
jgi:hypothetical protein